MSVQAAEMTPFPLTPMEQKERCLFWVRVAAIISTIAITALLFFVTSWYAALTFGLLLSAAWSAEYFLICPHVADSLVVRTERSAHSVLP